MMITEVLECSVQRILVRDWTKNGRGLRSDSKLIPLKLYSREPMSRMFSYTGRDNVNTTTIDNATDIGMPSSGSSGEAEVIWINLMLTVLLIVLPRMMEFMEFIFATVHEMSFPLGKTWTAVEKDENSFTTMDTRRAHEETREKTERDEANDGALI
uniref:Uncharacterized protein LOC111111097 isoform X2 n=1 Tax=Crassostrea virginica TaxID=6565 RepID=A0A8B8BJQ2_CRAVI|nr:uncharacterized protein LOC111111097 isoform X2 [Crassostrea virginica]